MGVETEYAITGLCKNGRVFPRDVLIEHLMESARDTLIHLRGQAGYDLFLENGSRLYLDCGNHPELATPECTDPLDVVRYIIAGERILEELSRSIEADEGAPSRILLCKSNVDYSARTTWGCHESYLYRVAPARLPAAIIPHLVTRVVLVGAGGFCPLAPGIAFTLSPRAWHLKRVQSSTSQEDRGIFHTKQESLSSPGHHRLHILCGESLWSERASWIKLGATSLLVTLADAGIEPGVALELQDPLGALQVFASDLSARRKVALEDGRMLSAVEIQFEYLERVQSHLEEPFMPSWASAVCEEWSETLELLGKNPRLLSGRLDWAIKRHFYGRWIHSRDFTWESIDNWNAVVTKLSEIVDESNTAGLSAKDVLARRGPFRSAVSKLGSFVRSRGLSWDGLEPFLNLRAELFELDMRFSELGAHGLFRLMDEASELDHRLEHIGNLDPLRTDPPADSRAAVRGSLIHRLSQERSRYRCGWNGIWDIQQNRVADFREPFQSEETWRDAGDRMDAQRLFNGFPVSD